MVVTTALMLLLKMRMEVAVVGLHMAFIADSKKPERLCS